MKVFLPALLAGICGVLLIVSFFVPPAQDFSNIANAWFNNLAAIAFVLGGANLLKINLRKVSDQQPGWAYAGVTVAAFLVTLIAGLFKIGVMEANGGWGAAFDRENSLSWWLYTYMYSPLAATMFSLLAFFVASAAFRAFRAKNIEATLLLVTAIIVLLGRTYAGQFMTSFLPEESPWTLPAIAEWINSVFNATGQRAIMIGIALGIVATSLKVILGIDRSYLGSE